MGATYCVSSASQILPEWWGWASAPEPSIHGEEKEVDLFFSLIIMHCFPTGEDGAMETAL